MRPLLIAAALTAIIAGDADARKKGVPVATPAGEARNCIPIQSIRNTVVRSDQVIDFYTNGNRVYRNTLPQSCPNLGFEQRFAYKTSLSQLCNVDIITVLYASPPQPGASCGLGKFQPVTLAKR